MLLDVSVSNIYLFRKYGLEHWRRGRQPQWEGSFSIVFLYLII